MSSATPDSSPIDYLITLKSHFEQELSEADAKVANLREQLEHVDALLLNQLVPTHGVAPLQERIETPSPGLFLSPQANAPTDSLDLAPTQSDPETAAPPSETLETTAAPEPTPAKSGRSSPRTMLPAYQELTRLEAITTVLLAHQGQAVTADALTQELFGTLSAVDHRAESKRLKTLLYQGEKNKLWQKGRKPSSYQIKGATNKRKKQGSQKVSPAPRTTAAKTVAKSKVSNQKPGATTKNRAKAKAPKAKRETATAKANSVLELQPPYQEMKKNEAIVSVLEQREGKAVHRDAIIQWLYGDLSSEDLKVERRRMTTALHRGVKTNKWQKASAPLSYQVVPAAKEAKPKSPGRKSKAPKLQPDLVVEAIAESTPAPTDTPNAAQKPKRGRKPAASKAKTSTKAKAKTPRKRATRDTTKAKV
ncbi:hypothetical protein C1752_08985 [Acaryochloris thomasi RCC1774]|uniref:Uncharacterized protein n=1 Tax=Acaryochloris thomasi RCC1774 TaxID=1764569 RepID=A0A2W1J958_9CYAN|nr:hypothetical protein [Acaryochloris thomasi]PZD70843.1 hypothetical protein C1752_08985 [Acaryochloris thomasi RCC1774]